MFKKFVDKNNSIVNDGDYLLVTDYYNITSKIKIKGSPFFKRDTWFIKIEFNALTSQRTSLSEFEIKKCLLIDKNLTTF